MPLPRFTEATMRLVKSVPRKVRRLGRRSVRTRHSFVDDLMREFRKKADLACQGSGCSACCRGHILASEDEVAAIVKRLDDPTRARIAAMADELRRTDVQPVCPLLDPETRACTVYEHRPMTCRVHHSLDADPSACEPVEGMPAMVTQHPMLHATAVAIYAEAERDGVRHNPLGQQLLDVLEIP